MSESNSFSEVIDKQISKLNKIQETINSLQNNAEFSHLSEEINSKHDEIQDLVNKLKQLKEALDRQRHLCEDVKNLSMLLNDLVEEITRLKENNKINAKISTSAEQAEENKSPRLPSSSITSSVEEKPNKFIPAKHQKYDLKYLKIDHIQDSEYTKLPRYMVGRIQIEAINKFVDVVNRAAYFKYDLLSRPKLTLKGQDLQLVRNFKVQDIEETKGKYFITDSDIARQINKRNMDKNSYNLLVILRHVKRIYEHRSGGIVRYILIIS